MSDFQEAMKEISRANDLLDVIAALAAQNAALREALERVITLTDEDNVDSYMLNVHEAERVLALDLPGAGKMVEGWREKAGLLDWAAANLDDITIRGSGAADDKWFVVSCCDGGNCAEDGDLLAALRAAKGGK